MANAICAYCACDYDDEDGDVCECGAEICSPDCMDNHLGKECDKYDEEEDD